MTKYPVAVSLPVALRAIDRARAAGVPIDIVINDADGVYLATLTVPRPDITLTVECLRASTMKDDEIIDTWLSSTSDIADLCRHGIQISPDSCTLEHFGEDADIIRVAEVI